MPVDLSVFERQKSIVDQQQLQREFELKKQLAMQQLLQPQRDYEMKQAIFNQELAAKQDMFNQEAALKIKLQNMRGQGGQPYVDEITGQIVTPPPKLLSSKTAKHWLALVLFNCAKSIFRRFK